MYRLQEHAAAALFPEMDKKRYTELRLSIREHGLLNPIVLYQGEILDGRNRYQACIDENVAPRFEDYAGNPFQYAWMVNGERRDLLADQRYLIWTAANELSSEWEAQQVHIREEGNRKRSEATKRQPRTEDGTRLASGPATTSGDTRDYSAETAAKTATAKATASGTNRGTVEKMDLLRRKRADLAEKVRTGEMKPTEALRQMKKDEVAGKVAKLPDGKFRVLYADPPWAYRDERAVDMAATAAKDHYPTMTKAELCALSVEDLAIDDAVLFCWATFPLLETAIEVVKAWGFKYKTALVWFKSRGTFGHYHKANAELVLICTRGSCTPDADKRISQVIQAERGEHSRKPEDFREAIDFLYPHGPRLELFRRGAAPDGWQVWGNEVE